MEKKTSEQVPLVPQSWCRNPEGYVKHQCYLKRFIEFLEENQINSTLPPERKSWDRGVDVTIQNFGHVDVKGFTVISGPKTITWDSPYWEGKDKPLYSESLTDYFLHPFGNDVREWVVAPASSLFTSFNGSAPFYWSNKCFTVQDLIDKLLEL